MYIYIYVYKYMYVCKYTIISIHINIYAYVCMCIYIYISDMYGNNVGNQQVIGRFPQSWVYPRYSSYLGNPILGNLLQPQAIGRFHHQDIGRSVDGRNPAPPSMVKMVKKML